MARAARDYLPIPVAEVDFERLFEIFQGYGDERFKDRQASTLCITATKNAWRYGSKSDQYRYHGFPLGTHTQESCAYGLSFDQQAPPLFAYIAHSSGELW